MAKISSFPIVLSILASSAFAQDKLDCQALGISSPYEQRNSGGNECIFSGGERIVVMAPFRLRPEAPLEHLVFWFEANSGEIIQFEWVPNDKTLGLIKKHGLRVQIKRRQQSSFLSEEKDRYVSRWNFKKKSSTSATWLRELELSLVAQNGATQEFRVTAEDPDTGGDIWDDVDRVKEQWIEATREGREREPNLAFCSEIEGILQSLAEGNSRQRFEFQGGKCSQSMDHCVWHYFDGQPRQVVLDNFAKLALSIWNCGYADRLSSSLALKYSTGDVDAIQRYIESSRITQTRRPDLDYRVRFDNPHNDSGFLELHITGLSGTPSIYMDAQ